MELALENGKNITLYLSTDVPNKDTDAELINVDTGKRLNVPNDIVLSLINFYKSDAKSIRLIYKSQSPYWFFHDLAHSLYTPELFDPAIIDISIANETKMYIKGIELARQFGLEEKYLTSVPEIENVLEPL